MLARALELTGGLASREAEGWSPLSIKILLFFILPTNTPFRARFCVTARRIIKKLRNASFSLWGGGSAGFSLDVRRSYFHHVPWLLAFAERASRIEIINLVGLKRAVKYLQFIDSSIEEVPLARALFSDEEVGIVVH